MGGVAPHLLGCVMICFGNLNWDATAYGLSYLNLNRDLGNTRWNNAARLSDNEKRNSVIHSMPRQKSMI